MPILNPLPESPAPDSKTLPVTPGEDLSLPSSKTELDGLARKIHRNFQDYGWLITLKKAAAYLLRSIFFYQVYRIYSIRLDRVLPPEDIQSKPFTFNILTPQNTDWIAQIEDMAEWMRGCLAQDIASGQLCLVALDGDRVAGFNLINLKEAKLILVNLKRKLKHGSAWSEHIAVKKEFRKMGLGSQLRYRIFQELKKHGVRRLYGGTLRSNLVSLSLARSVGFKEIGDVHYRKFLSVESWRYKKVRS
jgi:GNAT superfamily N-acetyltransferase